VHGVQTQSEFTCLYVTAAVHVQYPGTTDAQISQCKGWAFPCTVSQSGEQALKKQADDRAAATSTGSEVADDAHEQ